MSSAIRARLVGPNREIHIFSIQQAGVALDRFADHRSETGVAELVEPIGMHDVQGIRVAPARIEFRPQRGAILGSFFPVGAGEIAGVDREPKIAGKQGEWQIRCGLFATGDRRNQGDMSSSRGQRLPMRIVQNLVGFSPIDALTYMHPIVVQWREIKPLHDQRADQ
jgi:hypothetical protein